MKVGEKKYVELELINTGKAPLYIDFVTASCDCTNPETWDEGPIAPGKSAKIKVSFLGRIDHLTEMEFEGVVEKKLTILTNTKDGILEYGIKASVSK